VRDTLLSFTEDGFPCSAAMAELQCRLTFPAVPSGDNNGRIAPISFDSCVTLFTPCLGSLDSAQICSDASSGEASQGYAGIASRGSPWNTTRFPPLFDAETVSNSLHSKCSVAPADLQGCPERAGHMVHVNTDVFMNLEQMDAFVVQSLANSTYADDYAPCQAEYRKHLCQTTMPECNTYGNPMKMKYDECITMMTTCPYLGEKNPDLYDISDLDNDTVAIRKYARAVCRDDSDFFTRSNVGKHAVTCGLETPMLSAPVPPTPWHQDTTVMYPVCVLAGFLLGIMLNVVLSLYYKSKSPVEANKEASNKARNKMKGTIYQHQPQISMTNVAYPALNDGNEVPPPVLTGSNPALVAQSRMARLTSITKKKERASKSTKEQAQKK